MQYRPLGMTGLRVSEVGFGGIPIMSGPVSILPHYFSLSSSQSERVMNLAFESGCNLYDTAIVPEYGDSEIKVGIFARRHRGSVMISSKARAYSAKAMRDAVSSSLRNLQLGACDIYFVHQVAPENATLAFAVEDGAIAELVRRKQAGDIRVIGVATHHYDIALRAASDPRVDVIQIPGNILERGILDRIESTPEFRRTGILVHKVLAAGTLPEYIPISALIQFVLGYSVSSALVGIGTLGHVEAAFGTEALLRREIPLFNELIALLQNQAPVIPCDRCQRCVCDRGVEVANILRYYNYYHLGHRRWAVNQIAKMATELELCIDCPSCTVVCHHHVDIKETIREAMALQQNCVKTKDVDGRTLRPGIDFVGIGVGGLIVRGGRTLLLLRNRAPEKDCWTIPGGAVEFGETVEQGKRLVFPPSTCVRRIATMKTWKRARCVRGDRSQRSGGLWS